MPTSLDWVCLEDERGRVLIDGLLEPGFRSQTLVARRFRIFFGNGSAKLRINGRLTSIAATPDPIAYSVTQRGTAELPPGTSAPCA